MKLVTNPELATKSLGSKFTNGVAQIEDCFEERRTVSLHFSIWIDAASGQAGKNCKLHRTIQLVPDRVFALKNRWFFGMGNDGIVLRTPQFARFPEDEQDAIDSESQLRGDRFAGFPREGHDKDRNESVTFVFRNHIVFLHHA
jgi:hypothetical protein